MKTFSLKAEDAEAPSISTDFIKGLNQPQYEAVTHTDGPLLIIAGAGSGKTRVLTYRIAYILGKRLARAHEILALTFTNKAAREMRERIEELIGAGARHLWMGTFHSVFSRILRIECERIGYTRDFSIYDTDDSDRLIKGIMQEMNLDIKATPPRHIRFRISAAKNKLIDPGQFPSQFSGSSTDDIAARIYPVYEKRMKMSNAMDFDDLLVKPIELFEQHPEVLQRYQHFFRYILIDEYQDTNHAQYKVTQQLAAGHKNICVVGDDAQSIYSFRGADITNILNFRSDYPETKEIPLEQNYRSTAAILRCADSLIKNNKNQLEKTLWTENEQGDRIILLESFDQWDEANRVASYIQKMKLQKGYRYNEMAVLYRTNYQSRVFEDVLRRKGIAYQLVGGISFYQRKEVKDVIAYLRLLVNPNDREALLRTINEPARGVGQKSIEQLIGAAGEKDVPLWQILLNVDKTDIYTPAKNSIAEFASLIEEARSLLGKKPLLDVARHLMDSTGYIRQFVEENSHESLGRRENVLELLNAVSQYEETAEEPSLSEFLQQISLYSDIDDLDEQQPAVTLMTAHASKGLEFPAVFIVGLEEELFPIGGRNGDEADFEEERRLFYVAITRAQKHLFLSYARSRTRFGEESRMARSRFLNEVDPNTLQTEAGGPIVQRDADSQGRNSRDHDRTYIQYDWEQPLPTRSTSAMRRSSGTGSQTGLRPRPQSQLQPQPQPQSQSHSQSQTRQDSQSQPQPQTVTHYDSTPAPAARPGEVTVGSKVLHDKFGAGKVIHREGDGADTRITVFFQNFGQKKLLLRFAKLKSLD
jgi:DNA helicase II / ATP-dependent DNA helicase PcrA